MSIDIGIKAILYILPQLIDQPTITLAKGLPLIQKEQQFTAYYVTEYRISQCAKIVTL